MRKITKYIGMERIDSEDGRQYKCPKCGKVYGDDFLFEEEELTVESIDDEPEIEEIFGCGRC